MKRSTRATFLSSKRRWLRAGRVCAFKRGFWRRPQILGCGGFTDHLQTTYARELVWSPRLCAHQAMRSVNALKL